MAKKKREDAEWVKDAVKHPDELRKAIKPSVKKKKGGK